MQLGKLLLLGGLLAVEPLIPLSDRIVAKEVLVDYRKIYKEIEEWDSLKTDLIKEMGKEDYKRLNAIKAVIEIDESEEKIKGPFGDEKAIRFERIANLLQNAGILKLLLTPDGIFVEWSEEAERMLINNGYNPDNLGEDMVKTWRGDGLLGAPYPGIFRTMAINTAQTNNPQGDAKILEKKLGGRYEITGIIDSIMMNMYLGKDASKYIAMYDEYNRGGREEENRREQKQPETGTGPGVEQPPTQQSSQQSNQQPSTEKGGIVMQGTQETPPTEEEKKPQVEKLMPIDRVNIAYGRACAAFNNEEYNKAAGYYSSAFDIYLNEILKPSYGNLPISDKDIIEASPWALYFLGSKILCEGMAAYNEEKYDTAKVCLEKALKYFNKIEEKEKSNEKKSGVNLGENKKLCEQKLQDMERIVAQQQPLDVQADKLFVEGKDAYEKLEYNKAIEKFELAKEIYKNMGNNEKMEECEKYIEMSQGLLKQQEEQAAREKKSNDAEKRFKEGDNLLVQGDYQNAISYLDEAKKLYGELGDEEKVAGCNEKINLCNGKIFYSEGEKLYSEGKYEEAKREYEEAQFCFEVAGASEEMDRCKNKIEECKNKLEPKVLLTQQAKELVEIMKEKSEGGKTAWNYFEKETDGKSENEKNEILNKIANNISSLQKDWITYRVLINNIDAALEGALEGLEE